jgi:DNA-binding GntR family transcriptional regulator
MKRPTAAVPLRQLAYEHIQARIFSGQLRSGSVVSEQSIAAELGISRTPVREAIRHLEREGMLEPVPRYGTVVRDVDRRDLAELFELREALEPFAVARAAGRLTREDLSALDGFCREIRRLANGLGRTPEQALDAEGMRQLLAADMGFHLTLLRAAGNTRLLKIVSDSRLLVGVLGARRQEHTREVLRRTCKEHDAILQSVAGGDPRAAARHMAAHIRSSRDQALEAHDLEQIARTVQRDDAILPPGFLADAAPPAHKRGRTS